MKEINIPKKTIDDYLHQFFVKATAGSMPIIGSYLEEIFTIIIPSSLEERKQKWIEEITFALNFLLEKDEKFIEGIRNNEEFTSIIIETTQFALKTHQKEKIRLFRNAIIGSIHTNTSFYLKQTYLRLIDKLHPEQIAILNVLRGKKDEIVSLNSYDYFNIFFLKQKSLKNITPIMTRHYLLDLDNKGLIIVSSDIGEIDGLVKEHTYFSEGNDDNNLPYISITNLGLDFLKFILHENTKELDS